LYFFDIAGDFHLNDCIAFFGDSLYAAFCEQETKAFTMIDTENALFGVEAEIVLP